ncbi:unnamed protein product [Staurois parvus]|uniref:Uncharacterized protein n=1 Tax=Staurois parvus TaxID=386267 RepID=A0ABN9B6J8_9NEOB|nr:unnamed protein product [Staurois parvus]
MDGFIHDAIHCILVPSCEWSQLITCTCHMVLVRGPVQRSVFWTQRAPDRGAARSKGARTVENDGRCL